MRRRRRIAHALAATRSRREWLHREWHWLIRDLRDLKADVLAREHGARR